MLGRIKKGEGVIGMRAIRVKAWTFFKGPPIVRGIYVGKIRDWHMVQTRRGKMLFKQLKGLIGTCLDITLVALVFIGWMIVGLIALLWLPTLLSVELPLANSPHQALRAPTKPLNLMG